MKCQCRRSLGAEKAPEDCYMCSKVCCQQLSDLMYPFVGYVLTPICNLCILAMAELLSFHFGRCFS